MNNRFRVVFFFMAMEPKFLSPDTLKAKHGGGISSVSCNLPDFEVNFTKLNSWISTLMTDMGADLFRYKGVLAVKGCDEKYVFQGVHMLTLKHRLHNSIGRGLSAWIFTMTLRLQTDFFELFSGGFASEMTGSEGAGEWGVDEKRECRMVFIGKNLQEKHGRSGATRPDLYHL